MAGRQGDRRPLAQRGDQLTDFNELIDQAGRVDYGNVIEARHSGSCPLCGRRWEPGDEICYGRDEAAWVHGRHADQRD